MKSDQDVPSGKSLGSGDVIRAFSVGVWDGWEGEGERKGGNG